MDERTAPVLAGINLPDLARGPLVTVDIRQAAADHLVAWDADQRARAIHEAGHVVVARLLGIGVEAVDIKGRHGGATYTTAVNDDVPETATEAVALDHIAATLGGHAAERLVMGGATLGCRSDLNNATGMAYDLLNAGAVSGAPLFNLYAVTGPLIPRSVINQFGEIVTIILGEQRRRADALVEAHRDALLGFAVRLHERRRLATPEEVDAALRDAGLPL